MYQYNKYIMRHLVHSTLLITFSLTSIVWLTQALRFINFIVNQGISVTLFLQLTLLLIPSLLLMILPPAFFCAVLFTYNKLKMDSELIVMQSVGLSRWRLSMPALQVAAAITIIGYGIALYLQPVSYTKFKDMQFFLRNSYVSLLLQEGVFSTPVPGLTVFIRDRDRDGILHGILVHDNRLPEDQVTMMAEEAQLVQTPQGPRFLLTTGNRQEVRDGRLSYLTFDHYTMDLSFYTQSMGSRYPDTQEMFLGQLFTEDPTVSAQENRKRYAEGQQRLIWPAYTLTLTLIAMAILLSGQFNRRGHWQRIATAVLAATLLLFTAVGMRGLVAANPLMVFPAYVLVLLPALISSAVLLDFQFKRRKRASLADLFDPEGEHP